jgi:hypothetical protein
MDELHMNPWNEHGSFDLSPKTEASDAVLLPFPALRGMA